MAEASSNKDLKADGGQLDVSEIKEPLAYATNIHGVVTKVSPMKLIKRSAIREDELEIIVSDKSTIAPSPKKYKVQQLAETVVTTIDGLPMLSINSLITVKVKVTHCDEPVQINTGSKNLQKQDCTVADTTGACRLVLWEDKIGTLEKETSYFLTDVRIKRFANESFLSLTVDSTISIVDNIGDVVKETLFSPEIFGDDKIVSGEVLTVHYQEFFKCLACGSKINASESLIIQCMTCNAKVKSNKAVKSVIAKLQIKDGDTAEIQRVTMFTNVINQLVDINNNKKEFIEEYLLSLDELIVHVNKNMIVTSLDTK
uniref:Uncharacterized protein n=1 Tax=Amphimedon queenslandica TaxID=400682 RepID=A0A1X7TZZ5_AMPQE